MTLTKRARADREKVAKFIMDHSFATGPGDTIDDLLAELSWQLNELRERGFRTPGAIEKCEQCGYEFGDGWRLENCYYDPWRRAKFCPIEKAKAIESKKRWPSWTAKEQSK
jgi:hypothetical protein